MGPGVSPNASSPANSLAVTLREINFKSLEAIAFRITTAGGQASARALQTLKTTLRRVKKLVISTYHRLVFSQG